MQFRRVSALYHGSRLQGTVTGKTVKSFRRCCLNRLLIATGAANQLGNDSQRHCWRRSLLAHRIHPRVLARQEIEWKRSIYPACQR